MQPVPLVAAKAAGIALAATRHNVDSKLSIDAAVMAFAALINTPIITTDLEDVSRFKPMFPAVRFLSA